MKPEKTMNLIEKYSGAVPRYTSYPTAVQFRSCEEQGGIVNALRTLEPGAPVSVYIHIPFCHSLCHYCGCHTKIVDHTGVISAYINTLCREIEYAASYADHGINVSRIHFGGGSPNYAPTADIEKVLMTIRQHFVVEDLLQVDMECDPRLLNSSIIKELSRLGISRISLGVQDFDERVQKAVNRVQPLQHVRQQVACLRAHHIKDINFDLIIGLPEQTIETVRNTLIETVKIRPTRIAVFPYAHVPWMKKHQKLLEKYRFPTPEERFAMQAEADIVLCKQGYIPIGIDHYALPEDTLAKAQRNGSLQRNFQGYTDDPAAIILGFGLSAISQFRSVYTQNAVDALAYKKAVEVGNLPVAKECILNDTDILARTAIMRIMSGLDLDLSAFGNILAAKDVLSSLLEDGLVRKEGNTISVTDKGKPFTRIVASCFDTYFRDGHSTKERRHAQAV
jgi:oxygen-independent coproporphyrinogen III oxidase